MSSDIFKLSDEQELAVDITKNIAVSAGAGSGKTRVLTNRYLRLLEAGIEIEEIAAITFTEKAALEMKERIRKAVNAKISESGYEEKTKWMKHLDKLNRANISTIHGFCSNIIKENAAFLGVDFSFSIIDEIDKTLILRELTENIKNSKLENEENKEVKETLIKAFEEKYIYENIVDEILKIRNSVLEEGKSIKDFCQEAEEDTVEKLYFSIITDVDEQYLLYKLNKDLLDYNDLENMTLEILEDENLRERYINRYKTLLVDEFQDTNEIQKRIIYKLAADDNEKLIPQKLFIVGDFKQSIYGFRGTDYTIFKSVSKDIGQDGQKSLSTCYRSKGEIIHGINSIFKELIKDYEPLKEPNDTKHSEKRISLLTYPKVKNNSTNIISEVKKLLQGKGASFVTLEYALNELKENCNNITLKENKDGIAVVKGIKLLKDKGLEFKNICILVRSRAVIPDIEDELKRRKVPYCIIGGTGFYQKDEINEILNLYKVVIRGDHGEFSNEDNKNLIKALRGPIFQISDDLILGIKIEKDESKCENLYKAIDIIADGMEEGENKAKLSRFYNILDRLYKLKDRLSVLEILKTIIKECCVFEIMLTQNEGVQRFRNIEKLLHEAQKFDEEQLFTIEKFVEYIMLIDESEVQDSEASLDTEDSDAIKIMTIHQSKGLEFDGVIIPKIQSDLLSISKKYKPNVVYDKGNIILSKDIDGDELRDNTKYEEYQNLKQVKEIDEYIRLLYVAMTRAKDYIILTGGDDDNDPSNINEPKDKIKELNTFIKQIKYALNLKGADSSCIEHLDVSDIKDLETLKTELLPINIKIDELENRINYKCSVKPSSTVSATRYMHYLNCPRKFYLESILKIDGAKYIDQEKSEEISIQTPNLINAADLGTIVHYIIENINNSSNLKEDELIQVAIDKYALNNKEGIEEKLKHYIDGYSTIEKNRTNYGKLICKSNELEYTLSPLEYKKTSIIGFIDRLEVFEKENKLTAVITDYKTNHISGEERIKELVKAYELQLQIYGKVINELIHINGSKVDEIVLQLYFLDKAERIELTFDEDKIDNEIKNMDLIFSRNLSRCDSGEFEKRKSDECERCGYLSICISL